MHPGVLPGPQLKQINGGKEEDGINWRKAWRKAERGGRDRGGEE